MAKNLDQTGVLQVNGAWATSLKYESEVLGSRAGVVDLRFMQGRSEIARASVLTEEVAEIIGEKNAARISRHLAGDADKYLAVIKGELRGARLEYKEVRLQENAIEPPREPQTSNSGWGEKATGASDRGTEPGRDGPAGAPPTPQHIVAKYLVKHDKYYFDDQTVAFVDRGSRLSVQTQNSAIIKDLVEIAKSRDWQTVNVSGTKAFRREVWKEAHATGLKVSGYAPADVEQQAAEKTRLRRSDLSTDREQSPSPERESPAAEGVRASATALKPNRESFRSSADPARNIVYGTLVDHGEAPYRNDPSKSASYFVTIKDASGISRTHWGVGLAAAVREAQSSPQIGDEIGLRRVGSTPVTLLDRQGGKGEEKSSPITTKRHQWQMEKADFLNKAAKEAIRPATRHQEGQRMADGNKANGLRADELTPRQEAAAAIRSARTTQEELQLKYPDLNRAVFQHLASHDQFAEAYVKAGLIRETDRAQVIAQMRERLARGVERGNELKEPNDKQVNTLIRRSVERVAADIGRPAIDVSPRTTAINPPARDEMQVRG